MNQRILWTLTKFLIIKSLRADWWFFNQNADKNEEAGAAVSCSSFPYVSNAVGLGTWWWASRTVHGLVNGMVPGWWLWWWCVWCCGGGKNAWVYPIGPHLTHTENNYTILLLGNLWHCRWLRYSTFKMSRFVLSYPKTTNLAIDAQFWKKQPSVPPSPPPP